MGIAITGSIILIGTTDWEAGTTAGGSPIFALAAPAEASDLIPLGPVPYPPQTPPGPCMTSPPSGQKIKLLANPNKAGHTIAGVPMVSLGSMWIQGATAFPMCQPILGMSTKTIIATTPVITVGDLMMAIGIMTGLGIKEKP